MLGLRPGGNVNKEKKTINNTEDMRKLSPTYLITVDKTKTQKRLKEVVIISKPKNIQLARQANINTNNISYFFFFLI